jgi:ABC-type amino acid transport substrate-binding protein
MRELPHVALGGAHMTFRLIFALIFCLLTSPSYAVAETPSPLSRPLLVGVKDAPPFAMKTTDGAWHGISVDLWQHISTNLKLDYRFVEERSVPELLSGIQNGKFDIAVAAITVTANRARSVDFTQSFYSTGLGIAVPVSGTTNWRPIVRALTSFGFFQAILALLGSALLAGLIVWIFERRDTARYGGSLAKTFESCVWWAASAMSRRGVTEIVPRTIAGRLVALIWMVASVIVVAVFTAAVTSALTVKQLQGTVHGVSDLQNARVGATANTSTEEALRRLRISYSAYPTAADGLRALQSGRIDCFVYDKPLLAWFIQQHYRDRLQMLDITFEPQNYAFALPAESAIRRSVDLALLDAVHSSWWDRNIARYIGPK